MKKIIIVFICTLLFSCTKNQQKSVERKSNLVQENFKIDSLKVEDSLKINDLISVNYSDNILIFSNLKNKSLLDSIYSPIGINLSSYNELNLQKAISKKKEDYFFEARQDAKDWIPSFQQKWEENTNMKVFSDKNNLLILEYNHFGYSGGAHGFHNELYRVFDLERNKTIQLKDILKNPKDEDWSQIMMSNFDLEDQKSLLLVNKILPNNNFYFNKDKITFVYNQYEIAAYAAGVVYITLDFKKIKDLLNPDFITSYNIN